jgi:hypothetical protein
MFTNKDRESETRVKRSVGIPPLRPEFDKFLYAPIDELDDEMPFSVLSALARQNLDPWEEAATLAKLSRESAIARLTSMISLATVGPSARSVPAGTAARLVALLPQADRFAIAPLPSRGISKPSTIFTPSTIYLIVGVIILAYALLGH